MSVSGGWENVEKEFEILRTHFKRAGLPPVLPFVLLKDRRDGRSRRSSLISSHCPAVMMQSDATSGRRLVRQNEVSVQSRSGERAYTHARAVHLRRSLQLHDHGSDVSTMVQAAVFEDQWSSVFLPRVVRGMNATLGV